MNKNALIFGYKVDSEDYFNFCQLRKDDEQFDEFDNYFHPYGDSIMPYAVIGITIFHREATAEDYVLSIGNINELLNNMCESCVEDFEYLTELIRQTMPHIKLGLPQLYFLNTNN